MLIFLVYRVGCSSGSDSSVLLEKQPIFRDLDGLVVNVVCVVNVAMVKVD